ncbi:MAG TPA: YncE family protein [Pseudomonadota bacterium]|nr:YncE family protein [Pseudomonadota bacterium]
MWSFHSLAFSVSPRGAITGAVIATLIGGLAGCEREVSYPPGLSWGDPALPTYTSQQRLAVSCNGDDTLGFVSEDAPDRPQLLGAATVGSSPVEIEGPHHLTSSSDGKFIFFNLSNYVTNGGSGPHGAHGTGTVPGYLVKLDARTGRPLARVLVDRSPGDVIRSADDKLIFVSHYDLARLGDALTRGLPREQGYSSVAIIDAASIELLSMTPVCPTAHGMGLSPDGQRLYVTCSLSDELAVLDVRDPQKPQVTARVPVGPQPGQVGNPAYAPYALAVDAGGLVWISDNKSGDVRVFDPATMQPDPARVVKVGGVAMFADFSPDGQWLYVPHQGDDHVSAINTKTLELRDLALPKEACLAAHALRVLSPQTAAVVCEGDHLSRKGTVVMLDLTSWSVRGFVEVGLFPDGLTRLPAL